MFEFNEVILWLKDNPEWIALGVFGAAFIESFALIGVVIPGVVLLAVISGMAASTLNVFELVLIAYVASFLADILSFLLGTSISKSIDKKLDGPPGTISSDSKLPAVEHNKLRWSTKTTNRANMVNLKKPVNEDLQTVLNTQGLVADETRGITTSSARREVPSSVFGISTPGPIDKNAIAYTEFAHVRLGGSTFVMDDGDDKFVRKTKASEGPSEYYNKELDERGGELDVPHNELIRLRTRTGHQLLFHNSEDLIYIGNAKGTSWVELSSDGKVDVYAEDSISFHTKNDFNLTADRDITMEAGGNINIKASGQTTAEKDTKGKIQIESASKTSLVVGEGTYITTTGNLEVNSTGETKITSGGGSHINSGGNHLETAPEIHMNGPAERVAKQPVAHTTQRSPQHEPWTQHENLNPVAFKSALTDRDKTETVKNDLEVTPIPDTFKNART